MKFAFCQRLDQRDAADILAIPFWEGPHEAAEEGSALVSSILKSGDFKGKLGETAISYVSKEKEPRIVLLGLGKKENATIETLRRAYAALARLCQSKKAKNLNLLFPKCKQRDDFIRGIGEGLLLTNYAFFKLKGEGEAPVLLEKIGFIGLEKNPLLDKLKVIASGVHFVRDLVNGNADDITPKMLADTAKSFEKKCTNVKTVIFDKKKLEAEGFGLILAVNRASSLDPYLIQASYKGDPKSKDHIVLVGKGISYDTGGLSLKPTDGMLDMKADMAAGAAVLGTIKTASDLGLKINVTAVVPTTENCIGSKSYKLGDVYTSYSGKTVEVNNTDAEGRLVLADALSYTVRNLKPTCIVDLATLTGAMVIALGIDMSGLFSNDEELSKNLMAASESSGELLWKMPLFEDYKEPLKSDIADLINTAGRDAGSIKAALFLQEFVGDNIAWAHIDIAGPAFQNKPKHYHPTKGTGYGLRLLIDFLHEMARS